MPWTIVSPPAVAKNWTQTEKRKCVTAANAVLDKNGSEEDAIFACISAAGKSDQNNMTLKTSFKGLQAINYGVKMAQFTENGFWVEVFAVGTWNGLKFLPADLDDMVNNFVALKDYHIPVLKLGHNDEQPMTDGQPAIGWVEDLKRQGDKLLAFFVNVPEVIRKAAKKKLYKNVSVEILFNVRHKGKTYKNVLDAVALLGADAPAVNVLADLDAYMNRGSLESASHAQFTAIGGNVKSEVGKMTEAELQAQIDALEAQITTLKAELTKETEKNISLERDLSKVKAELKARDEVDQRVKFNRAKEELVERLDAMVKDGKIVPATREQYLEEFREDEAVIERITFALDALEKAIENNPGYFGNKKAREDAKRKAKEQGERADKIVLERINEYRVKNPKATFSEAKRAVLAADKELAKAYVDLEPVTA